MSLYDWPCPDARHIVPGICMRTLIICYEESRSLRGEDITTENLGNKFRQIEVLLRGSVVVWRAQVVSVVTQVWREPHQV